MNDVNTSQISDRTPSTLTSIGALAVALLGGGLLLDAAVETWWSGSPVRWWAVGAAALYVAVLALTWHRRIAWRERFGIFRVIALALLASTIWRPAGLTDGVRLLGQPPSTVQSAAVALVLALAVTVFLRAAAIPMWLRVFGCLCAAYGVAAFGLGIAHGNSMVALLHGSSFWELLPFFLQGAFVGVVVLFAALIVQIVQAGVRWVRPRSTDGWSWPKTVALVLSIAIVMGGWRSDQPTRLATGELRHAIPNSAQMREPAGQVLASGKPWEMAGNDLSAQVKPFLARTEPARYDLDAGAATLGKDVDSLFLFVRDHIRYEAYPGALKGASLTFAGRAGNAVDRSLLLARLLRARGFQVHFAFGTLPRAEAERLFARVFEPPASPEERSVTEADQSQVVTEAKAFSDRVFARAKRDYGAMIAALGTNLPTRGGPTKEEVVDEISPHVWLQVFQDGRWIDLDSSFGDATVGRRYTEPARVTDEVGDELTQRVTLRVVAEYLSAGALGREAVIEVTRSAESLLDTQIFLVHAPGRGVGGMVGIGEAVAAEDRINRWTPVLWIDGDAILGRPIDFGKGPVAQSSNPAAGTPLGGVANLFGAPPTSGAGTERDFVSEWVEFELTDPGGRHQSTRRILADRGGVAWREGPLDRATLRPLARNASGPLAPQAFHNVFFTAGHHNLANLREGFERLVIGWPAYEKALRAGTSQVVPFEDQAWPIALKNFAWLVWNDQVIVPSLNDAQEIRLYPDAPQIVIFTERPNENDALITEIDLRRDQLRALARDPAAERARIERQIWFGALEGAFEHEVVALETALEAGRPTPVVSASSLLTDEGAIAFTGAQNLDARAMSPEVFARLRHAVVVDQATVVVSRQALKGSPSGWWEIDRLAHTRAVEDDLNGAHDTLGRPIIKTPENPAGNLGAGGSTPGESTTWTYNPKTGGFDGPAKRTASRSNETASILVTISIGNLKVLITTNHAMVAAGIAAAAAFAYWAVNR